MGGLWHGGSMDLRDAATVILLRGATQTEVYLLKRHQKSGFMAGAHVFPGGKLDPEDVRAAAQLLSKEACLACLEALDPTPSRALTPEQAGGLYLAAIRETFEEAGVLLAQGATDFDPKALRKELQAGAPFGELLAQHGLTPDLDALVYWAHWVTPSVEPRRFDTRFFVARMPAGQEASIDAHEAVEARWMAPKAALGAHAEDQIFLPPPTLRTLEELAELDFDAVRGRAGAMVMEPILPKLVADSRGFAIVLPWDPEYTALEGEGWAARPRGPALATRIQVVLKM